MQCQFCANQATIHLTDIVNRKKRETHLCEGCAREKNIIPDAKQELHIPALLQFLLGSQGSKQAKEPEAAEVCPECGIKYAQFKGEGRLGCPHDYEAFRARLEPLLSRIHRATEHEGKKPRNRRRVSKAPKQSELREQLQLAILAEDYEEAARLRDRLARKETAE